jgi:translation initiation factor 1
MTKKKERIDTSAERHSLTDNPFGNLAGGKKNLPPGPEPAKNVKPEKKRAYTVEKSRKGGYKVRTEKRAAGKVVTILEGVTGDVAALAREIQKVVGAGGKAQGGVIEVQGDHRTRLEAFLREKGL